VKAELSRHDHWRPNLAGQAALAALVWQGLGYRSAAPSIVAHP
jgi:hypothetical protein